MSYEGGKPHAVTHLDGSERYSYDANGNMVSRNDGTRTWTLEWTPENMLHSATSGSDTVTVAYDADGMMVARSGEGEVTFYVGKLFQHNITTNTFTKQYQFNGRLIALREGLATSSPVSFMAANQLGSTTTTLWADGTVRADQRYTPWGEERWASNATPTEYQYTSQRNDSTLGLYDYNARYYDPAIGRFISADSIVPDPAAPQSLNRFSYVRNSPINYTDPTGHVEWDGEGLGGSGTVDTRLPILSRDEAIDGLKSIGQGIVVVVSVLPGAGDVVDVYDISRDVLRGNWLSAGANAGLALLPGATRAWRSGGDAVQGAFRGSNELIYRGMREGEELLPQIGETARTLGVRPDIDIPISNGQVFPNSGGVSVSPNSPSNLPPHRRPSELGGTGKDPVWCINTCDLSPDLQYRPDPHNPTGHGFIEPIRQMSFETYQNAIQNTRNSWTKIGH